MESDPMVAWRGEEGGNEKWVHGVGSGSTPGPALLEGRALRDPMAGAKETVGYDKWWKRGGVKGRAQESQRTGGGLKAKDRRRNMVRR